MRERRRRRWPATNAEALTRRVARQLPELTARQVTSVLHTALVTIRDSLALQVEQGVERPRVTIRSIGTFEARQYRPTRKPHLNGSVVDIPARWRLVFVPSNWWRTQMDRWPTRTTRQEDPAAITLEEETWDRALIADAKEGCSPLSDLPEARRSSDRRR